MTASRVPPPPFNVGALDGPFFAAPWRAFLRALFEAVQGEGFDKVDAAYRLARAAAPKTTQVIAGAGLYGAGSALSGNVALSLYKAKTSVANLPAANNIEGEWAYATDARKPGEAGGVGTGVPCFWSNGRWVAVTSGATVTS